MATKEVKLLINARDNASGTIKKIAGTVAKIAVAGAAVRGLMRLAEVGDDIGKQAKRIGVTAEQWQKLSFAARRSGSDQSEMETGMRRMASTIFDAERGVTAAVDALNELGLTYDQLKGKGTEQQFSILAERINQVTDATDKSAIAQDIFGLAGTKLIPMLSDYRKLSSEAERIGVITNQNVAAAEEFKDSMENLKTGLISAFTNSGILQGMSRMAGYLESMSESVTTAFNYKVGIDRLARGPGVNAENIRNVGKRALGHKPTKGKGNLAAIVGAMERSEAERILARESAAPSFVGPLSFLNNIFPENVRRGFKPFDSGEFEDTQATGKFFEPSQWTQTIGDAIGVGLAKEKRGDFDGGANPQQAFVARFLSGLTTAQRPAEKTAKATEGSEKKLGEVVNLLGGLITVNKKMLDQRIPVTDL